jgi:hypothetical protein
MIRRKWGGQEGGRGAEQNTVEESCFNHMCVFWGGVDSGVTDSFFLN